MNKIYTVIVLILSGCAVSTPSVDNNCVGNSGTTYSCSGSTSCSKSGGYNCSQPTDGVYCCGSSVGTTGTGSGSQYCSTGECYSFVQNYCCPNYAPYACKGGCYATESEGLSAGCTNYKTQCY